MSPSAKNRPHLLPADVDFELLKELESQHLSSIRKLRKYTRFEMRVPVLLQPGNLSAPAAGVRGTSRGVSPGGCMVHFPCPVGVGDVFRISIEDASLDVSQVYARSLRCIMLRDDVFEVAFSFFNPIRLDKLASEIPSSS